MNMIDILLLATKNRTTFNTAEINKIFENLNVQLVEKKKNLDSSYFLDQLKIQIPKDSYQNQAITLEKMSHLLD